MSIIENVDKLNFIFIINFEINSYINDDYLYFQNFVKNFHKITNCSTVRRPLGTKRFEYEINEELLEQYHLQIQSEIDKSPFIDPNYFVEVYYLDTTSTYQNASEPEIIIIPTLIKFKEIVTNDSNFAKLLINILNALSLWLSLSVLDLHIYLLKLFSAIKKFYFLLLKLKNCLNPNKFIV